MGYLNRNMRNGKLKECGPATPQPYAAYHPTAEAGGYLKDGRSATAGSDTSHIPVEWIYMAKDSRSATADSDTSHIPVEWIYKAKDSRSATADSDTSHIPVEWIYKAKDSRSATADSYIRHDIERTCESDNEKRKKDACCGSCRRATIIRVTPGFSRGVRTAIKHGVAEPHS